MNNLYCENHRLEVEMKRKYNELNAKKSNYKMQIGNLLIKIGLKISDEKLKDNSL